MDLNGNLDLALAGIEKQFGKGAIMRLGDVNIAEGLKVIKSGSVGLNLALGVGGYPYGRIIEIYGPEASGKTTLALHAIAECQRNGGVAAFIDAEHALDVSYARNLGIKVEELLFSQPTTGEEALEIADMLVRSASVDLIIIDSVAALVPKAELEGEMGDSHVGLQARLMSQALRKLTGSLSKGNTCMVFINQIRMKIGVMFGSPETTTGGNALKFYASQRLDVRRIASIKDKDTLLGNRTRVRVVKNKVAPPYRTVEFDIMYGKGISYEGDLLDLAVDRNIVQKSGSWYSYNGNRIGQGRENTKGWLVENQATCTEIERAILEMEGFLPGDAQPPAE
ncbi:MAG: recombinase RecA [Myxococcota bacterium]|nr:recombinase RecA [Myxococcota bacterium]